MKTPPHFKTCGNPTKLANEMLDHAEKMTREVLANREEILEAFVAKYSFQPDECEQIVWGNTWAVVRIDPERVTQVQRAIILDRLRQKHFTWWQRRCLAMAGL